MSGRSSVAFLPGDPSTGISRAADTGTVASSARSMALQLPGGRRGSHAGELNAPASSRFVRFCRRWRSLHSVPMCTLHDAHAPGARRRRCILLRLALAAAPLAPPCPLPPSSACKATRRRPHHEPCPALPGATALARPRPPARRGCSSMQVAGSCTLPAPPTCLHPRCSRLWAPPARQVGGGWQTPLTRAWHLAPPPPRACPRRRHTSPRCMTPTLRVCCPPSPSAPAQRGDNRPGCLEVRKHAHDEQASQRKARPVASPAHRPCSCTHDRHCPSPRLAAQGPSVRLWGARAVLQRCRLTGFPLHCSPQQRPCACPLPL